MQIQQGVRQHVIKTNKFKDIGIHIRFRNVLTENNASARSLLALILCDRCKKYDTKKKMSDSLDTMYGAIINAQTVGYGYSQVIELRSRIIDPSYLEEGNTILKDIFMFLHEIIFEPLLCEDVFQESKLILMAKVERMQDEPSQYAISQGLKIVGEGTPLGISAIGELEIIKTLTLQDIQEAYHQMIKNDAVDIIVCGDVEVTVLQTHIQEQLAFTPRDTAYKTYYRVESKKKDAYVEKYKHISQSSIMMVYTTNTSILDKDYYPQRLGNAMLGQYSTSLLFQEVREKNSLCYSIFSNLIAYDGALGITTGVEKEHIEKTISLIKKQMQRICDGDFEDTLFDVSKQMIVNSLKASRDSMASLIALQYQNNLLGTNKSEQDIIQCIEAVKKEDVIQAMKKCDLALTFVLTKENAHENS